jgi:hypothetical protein
LKTRILGLGAVAVALAASVVFGAGASHVATAAQATAAATMSAADIAKTTLVRVVHASPDAPNVDVYLDKGATPAIANLAFDSATDGYLPVPAGDHQVTITAAGDTKTVVYDEKLTLPGGTALTVIAEGLLADKSFGVRITVDDVSPTNGKARVKVTHAVADAPAVDLATADFKTTLITGLPYGYSQTITVDAGSYDLVVVPTGKQTPVVIDLKGTKLDADQIYSVFATGKLSGTVKPLLFVTSPVPGFLPPAVATPEATMAATASK